MEQDVAKVKVDSVGTMIVRVVVDTICERKIWEGDKRQIEKVCVCEGERETGKERKNAKERERCWEKEIKKIREKERQGKYWKRDRKYRGRERIRQKRVNTERERDRGNTKRQIEKIEK
jgi:hypothetical protein